MNDFFAFLLLLFWFDCETCLNLLLNYYCPLLSERSDSSLLWCSVWWQEREKKMFTFFIIIFCCFLLLDQSFLIQRNRIQKKNQTINPSNTHKELLVSKMYMLLKFEWKIKLWRLCIINIEDFFFVFVFILLHCNISQSLFIVFVFFQLRLILYHHLNWRCMHSLFSLQNFQLNFLFPVFFSIIHLFIHSLMLHLCGFIFSYIHPKKTEEKIKQKAFFVHLFSLVFWQVFSLCKEYIL